MVTTQSLACISTVLEDLSKIKDLCMFESTVHSIVQLADLAVKQCGSLQSQQSLCNEV